MVRPLFSVYFYWCMVFLALHIERLLESNLKFLHIRQ